MKFEHVVLDICEWSDRHTDTQTYGHTDMLISHNTLHP